MHSIQGTIKNGIVYPNKSIEEHDGESVIITFIESDQNTLSNDNSSWDSEDWEQFDQLIANCLVDTGIEDLAHQHDHYIHGTPKRESYP
jgi:hypothetical protein